MAILDKQDFEFIISYFIPEKYEKKNCITKQDFNDRGYYYSQLSRILSFVLPELNKDPVFTQEIANAQYTPKELNSDNMINCAVEEAGRNNIDLSNHDQAKDFFLLLEKTEGNNKKITSIVSYLQTKHPDFFDNLVAPQTFLSRKTMYQVAGAVATTHQKNKKEKFTMPDIFFDEMLNKNNRNLSTKLKHLIETEKTKFKSYKLFFDGLLKTNEEQVKQFLEVHPEILIMSPEAISYFEKFPQNLKSQQQNTFDDFQESGTMLLSRTIKFDVIDIFIAEDMKKVKGKDGYSANEVNNSILEFFYKVLNTDFNNLTCSSYINDNKNSSDYSSKVTYALKEHIPFNFESSLDLQMLQKFKEQEEELKRQILEYKECFRNNSEFLFMACEIAKKTKFMTDNDGINKLYVEAKEYKNSWILKNKLDNVIQAELNEETPTSSFKI